MDKLTYAGNLSSLAEVANTPRYHFIQADICDSQTITKILEKFQPDGIMHLAAESHVDRSIDNADPFIQSNILGTYQLLESTRHYWQALPEEKRTNFRFLHVSTDEVYGDLAPNAPAFSEESPYQPSSPYSASKAASDHLVQAWHRTYGLPTIISHSSNNFGAFQHKEKFIPKMISQALQGLPLTLYGDGQQIRDWLFVDDHAKALCQLLNKGKIGETYNIGGNCEKTNVEVAQIICQLLEQLAPQKPTGVTHYQDLITFVEDRQGHDRRYSLNNKKIENCLGWNISPNFGEALRKTIQQIIANN